MSSHLLPSHLRQLASKEEAISRARRRVVKPRTCLSLIADAEEALMEGVDASNNNNKKNGFKALMDEAQELCERAGLSTSTELTSLMQDNVSPETTGGYSNTDHLVLWTGDFAVDRTTQLKHDLMVRIREQRPESLRETKWDKPRTKGTRRRRIVREKDQPAAPPAPPTTGYVIYVGQATTKYRHDHPDEEHSQTSVVQQISKDWRTKLSEEEREMYNSFAKESNIEYQRQHIEFRATGSFTPSENFEKVQGASLWMHRRPEERNALENEIATYESVTFRPRPAHLEAAYQERHLMSIEKRKKKLKEEKEEQDKQREKLYEKFGIATPQKRARRGG